ncbi:osm1 [Symbiodinium microadriaticum]|nr:osm1 [Symbiodinium microadriaticum]
MKRQRERKRPPLNSEEQAAASWLAGKLQTLEADAPIEGTGAVKTLRELSALPASVEVQTCAKVTALLRSEEGHCHGCVYTQGRDEIRVQGPVLLCAGGFLGDSSAEGWLAFARPDLRHLPLILGAACSPAPSSVAMASALGAGTRDLECVRLHPTAQATHGRLRRALAQPGLIVDAMGQVVDSDRGEDEVASEMLQRPGTCRLLGRGSGPPTAARQSLAVLAQDMQVSATSLGEALRQCGVMDEVDTMGEGYAPSSSSTSVATPRLDRPCWVTDVTPALLCCDGGLVVEGDSGAVLNSEGSTIRGLFAAGEAVANRGSASPFLSCVASALRAAEAASKASRFRSAAWKAVEPVFPTKAASPPASTEDSSVKGQMVQRRLRELLSKHLTVDVLQGVLARAHLKDGSLTAASDELLAQLLPALEIPTTSQVLQMSIKDPGGLPTRTMQTDLPEEGELLPREVNATCVPGTEFFEELEMLHFLGP